MRLEFHRQVASDISQIMDHYVDAGGQQLADEFDAEFEALAATVQNELLAHAKLLEQFGPPTGPTARGHA